MSDDSVPLASLLERNLDEHFTIPDVTGELDGSEFAVVTPFYDRNEWPQVFYSSNVHNDAGQAAYLGRYGSVAQATEVAERWIRETAFAIVHERAGENGEPCPIAVSDCPGCTADAQAAGIPLAVIQGKAKLNATSKSEYRAEMIDAGRGHLLRPEDFNE